MESGRALQIGQFGDVLPWTQEMRLSENRKRKKCRYKQVKTEAWVPQSFCCVLKPLWPRASREVESLLHHTACRSSLREDRARMSRQEPWRRAAHWLALQGSLSLLSSTAQAQAQWWLRTQSSLGPCISVSTKTPQGYFGEKIFSTEGPLPKVTLASTLGKE